MSDHFSTSCRRNAWAVAIAAGLLLALLLMLVAKMGFLVSVVLGALLAVALGLFLVWAFCTPVDEGAARRGTASVAASHVHDSADSEGAAETRVLNVPAEASPSSGPAAGFAASEPVLASSTLEGAMARGREAPARPVEFLSAPRDGRADDLKKIKGIGPKLEALLNELGVWHFDQIASWTARDIAEIDEKLGAFRGRVTRDEWVRQARLLARGDKTEFSERVDRGEVYRGEDDDAV